MKSNRLKYPKKTKKIVGCVLFSLAAFSAFHDYNDDGKSTARLLSREDENTGNNEQLISPTIGSPLNQLQMVVPSVIDETPQQIMTELFSNPKAVMEERNQECKATSQVKISFDTEAVILSTFDKDGVEKKEGGDEFYITYHGNGNEDDVPPDVVAHVKDLQNGQYMLELVQPFLPFEVERLEGDILPGGIFTVALQYTCGLGAYMPPTKKTWEHGGSINSSWKAQVPQGFLPPITMARNRPKPPSFGEEMASYKAIYAIGDSTMRMFMGGCYQDIDNMGTPRRENFGHITESDKSCSVAGVGMAFTSSTLDKFIGIAKWLVQGQGIEGDDGKDYALLLGSGVWDILDMNEKEQPNFDDHLKALKEFIGVVKSLTSAKLYWKSMTAVHIHVVRGARDIERVAYMSTSRAKMLYDAQMGLMRELDIPVIDMYNFTFEAADQTLPGDGRHYNGIFNERMMDYFYPVKNKEMDNVRLSDDKNAVVEKLAMSS
mmetsp:Transcript_17431/g.21292  ORF Transcript_17431/g.21292 Transcript_17431/m.21292 type:complete len:489 (-) Transcript_17431:122-1588(-)